MPANRLPMLPKDHDFLRFDSPMAPAAGCLLVANPFLSDPNFRRAVVLLTECNAEGAFGLVLNKPIQLELTDLVKDLPANEERVHYGGPVQLDTLHFLHRRGADFSNCTPVREDICWGGNFDMLRLLMQSGELSHSDIRFFVGYAGWSGGQLEKEVAEQGWVVTPATPELVFAEEPETIWPLTLRQMGARFEVMANFPEDPSLN